MDVNPPERFVSLSSCIGFDTAQPVPVAFRVADNVTASCSVVKLSGSNLIILSFKTAVLLFTKVKPVGNDFVSANGAVGTVHWQLTVVLYVISEPAFINKGRAGVLISIPAGTSNAATWSDVLVERPWLAL